MIVDNILSLPDDDIPMLVEKTNLTDNSISEMPEAEQGPGLNTLNYYTPQDAAAIHDAALDCQDEQDPLNANIEADILENENQSLVHALTKSLLQQ